MRNGGLRIPSLMMSFGNSSRSLKSDVFSIQKNNLFPGPKRPIVSIQPLTLDQRQAIKETITTYKRAAIKQSRVALLLTLIISSILLFWVF